MNADTGARRRLAAPATLSVSRWRDFLPAPMAVDARERWRAIGGAAVGVLFTALLCGMLAPADGSLPWLVAPIHVPVIDDERRLVGIITQSDIVRALARHD